MVQFASYLRRVLFKTRLIFPRINGPNVITNKSNWQEANLLEKLTGLGRGGVNFCWVYAAGLSEPVPIILVVYSVTKIDPTLVTFGKM